LPRADGDAALVTQVWTKLANALKFSSKAAAPRIQIEGATPGGEHVYTVRDNGAGFDPRYAEKLFQPFKRLHGEAEFSSTGIGLRARAAHRRSPRRPRVGRKPARQRRGVPFHAARGSCLKNAASCA
jgi:light-regulated signal transduction histidine kinase (bacteriophytochrome)